MLLSLSSQTYSIISQKSFIQLFSYFQTFLCKCDQFPVNNDFSICSFSLKNSCFYMPRHLKSPIAAKGHYYCHRKMIDQMWKVSGLSLISSVLQMRDCLRDLSYFSSWHNPHWKRWAEVLGLETPACAFSTRTAQWKKDWKRYRGPVRSHGPLMKSIRSKHNCPLSKLNW